MVVVLDSDEENEDERQINVHRPEDCTFNINTNTEERENFNLGREIRDSPLRINLNIPEYDFQDSPTNIPNHDDQMENNESPPTNYDQMTRNEEGDSHVISVHSSDTSCAPSDSPIFLNESIPNNNNRTPIDNVRVRVQTRSRTENNNILNSGVRTRSMVARSPTGLFTQKM